MHPLPMQMGEKPPNHMMQTSKKKKERKKKHSKHLLEVICTENMNNNMVYCIWMFI